MELKFSCCLYFRRMLPYWFPFHPGRYWCHCRMVYLPMCYVYGSRLVCKEDDLIRSLKSEIYPMPYDSIDWPAQKWNCCSYDLYYKPTLFLKVVFGLVSLYEKFHLTSLRKASLEEVMALIRVEDESTKYVDIGPVRTDRVAVQIYCRSMNNEVKWLVNIGSLHCSSIYNKSVQQSSDFHR